MKRPHPVIDFYNSPEFWRFRMDLAEGRAAICAAHACRPAPTHGRPK